MPSIISLIHRTTKTRNTAWILAGAVLFAPMVVEAATPQPPKPPTQQPPTQQPPTQQPPTQQPPTQQPPLNPAVPLRGLTADQIKAFNDGLEEFEEHATKQEGLGPIFNRDSCVACHSVPAIGGSSNISVTRFGHGTPQSFDPLTALGGSLLQERAIDPAARETVPSQANVVVHRQSTALFGLGLIEAIPDATIQSGVRQTAVDGVKGRAAIVVDVASGKPRVGRFGWKAQQATILAFSGDAYVNEIGITNRLFPTENAPNGNLTLLKKYDTVKDPEDIHDPVTGKDGIDKLADFMRMLSPPPTRPLTAQTGFGAKIFLDVGCTSCHTPMMKTGPSPISGLSNQQVFLYSDLLLHDMGSLSDGVSQGDANVHEMKTPPLWGVGASGPYLHDGRAPNLDAAIKGHDGEAKASRDRYLKLRPDQQQLLLMFLDSI